MRKSSGFMMVLLILVVLVSSTYAGTQNRVVVLIETSRAASAIRKSADTYRQKTGQELEVQKYPVLCCGRHFAE